MMAQILTAGLGGQGVLFAARVLAGHAVAGGHKVIGSETHGMAQRGGSVVSHLKVGDYGSSVVRAGAADCLVCFEALETYRYLHMLAPGAACFVNAPAPDFLDRNVARALDHRTISVHTLDAHHIAARLKAPLSANLVILGLAAASGRLGSSLDAFRQTITNTSPERFRKQNLAAFTAGIEGWSNEQP